MKENRLMNLEDSQWIANNLLVNYCLWDDDSILIESFVKNMNIALKFDVHHFHLCITGFDKKFYSFPTPESLNFGIHTAEKIYSKIETLFEEQNYVGQCLFSKVENSKKLVIIFSEKENPKCSVEEIALKIFNLYREILANKHIASSLITNQSGYEQLHRAYIRASRLNQLTFFRSFDQIITEKLIDQIALDFGLLAVDNNIRKLQNIMGFSSVEEVEMQIDLLFMNIIANSYNYTYFSTAFNRCRLLINQFVQVYGIKVTSMSYQDINQFNSLEDYTIELKKIVCEIYSQLKGKTIYSSLILSALYFIANNYNKNLSLQNIADYLGINATSLSSKFNYETGISISEYISACRIKEAKKLLKQNHDSIVEISEKVGFTSQKYFSLIFKQLTHTSPSLYRKQALTQEHSTQQDTEKDENS